MSAEIFGPVLVNEIKIVPENAQCHETNLALILTILRSLVFEIWSIFYSEFVGNWGLRTNSE